MEPTYRVVFQGELVAGFELSEVKQSAATRLKAPPTMVEQLFSARRVILKKGIALDIGKRYIQELQNLGMSAVLESEEAGSPRNLAPATETTPVQPPKPVTPDPLDGPMQDFGAYSARTEIAPQSVFGTANSALTALSDQAGTEATVFIPRPKMPAMAATPAMPATNIPIEPTIFVPRADISEMPGKGVAEQTLIVPRASAKANEFLGLPAEQTIVLPRKAHEAALGSPAPAPSTKPQVWDHASQDMSPVLPSQTSTEASQPREIADATLIVPRNTVEPTPAIASEPVAKPDQAFEAERSLIANADTLAQYFSSASSTRTDEPALLDESEPQALKLESAEKPNRGSNDKTEVVDGYPTKPSSPAPRMPHRGSNDTTLYVPQPAHGSSDPTVMASLDDPIHGYPGYGEDHLAPPKQNSKVLLVLLVLAALGAVTYYYFAMH